jgi:hypothetical protein
MEQRKAHRVVFERGFSANIMAIDGTWQRPCTMQDVSETGAKLTIGGSIEGLPLKEFFLVLSTVEGIPALPTSLGQRRSGWRQSHQSG